MAATKQKAAGQDILGGFLARREKEVSEEARRLAIPDVDLLSTLAGLLETARKKSDGNYNLSAYQNSDFEAWQAGIRNEILRPSFGYSSPARAEMLKANPNEFYQLQFSPHEPGAWMLAALALEKIKDSPAANQVLKHYLKFCKAGSKEAVSKEVDDAIYLAVASARGAAVPLMEAKPGDVATYLAVRDEIPKLEQEKKQLEEKIAEADKDLKQTALKNTINYFGSFARPAGGLEEAWAGVQAIPVQDAVRAIAQLENYVASYGAAVKAEHDKAISGVHEMLGEFKGAVSDAKQKVSLFFGGQKEKREVPKGVKSLANAMFDRALAIGQAGMRDLADILGREKPFKVGDAVVITKTYHSAHSCSMVHAPCSVFRTQYFWGENEARLPINTKGTVAKIKKEDGDLCIELNLDDKGKGKKGVWYVHPDELDFADRITVLLTDAGREIEIIKDAREKNISADELYKERGVKKGMLKELRDALPALIFEKCSEGRSNIVLSLAKKQVGMFMIQKYKITPHDWDQLMASPAGMASGRLSEFTADLLKNLPESKGKLAEMHSRLANYQKYVAQFN